MGLINALFDFITSFDGSSYIEEAKEWGDEVWNSMSRVNKGVLVLTMIDERLYIQMRLKFRNDNVGIISVEEDRGWAVSSNRLSKQQQRQLKKEGCITIKRYR